MLDWWIIHDRLSYVRGWGWDWDDIRVRYTASRHNTRKDARGKYLK